MHKHFRGGAVPSASSGELAAGSSLTLSLMLKGSVPPRCLSASLEACVGVYAVHLVLFMLFPLLRQAGSGALPIPVADAQMVRPSSLPTSVAEGLCQRACHASPLVPALPPIWRAGDRVLAVPVTDALVISGYVCPSPLPIGVAGGLCWQACRASSPVAALPASRQAADGVLAVPFADAQFLICFALGLVCGSSPIGPGRVKLASRPEGWAGCPGRRAGHWVQFFSCFILLDLVLYVLVQFLFLKVNMRPLCTQGVRGLLWWRGLVLVMAAWF